MNKRQRVVITDFVSWPLDAEQAVLGEIASVESLGAWHEEDLAGRIDDADAVMVYHNLRITARTIDRLRNCKLIVRCGVGYDNVEVAAAHAKGIPVANVPDYGTEEVADSAIGLALALARGISYLNSRLRAQGVEWTYEHVAPLPRLRGRVFGIVGLGRIGSATALRAKSLGMDVWFYDPYVPDGKDKSLGVKRVEDLKELISHSYILSLHCPATDETRNLINAETLNWFPPGSFLVNTSRGTVVDTGAIPDAIAAGTLAGAAIDVLPQEPPSENDPLLVAWRNPRHPAHHRLIVNAHAAFYSEEGVRDMRVKGAEACRRALLGLPLRNIVNWVV